MTEREEPTTALHKVTSRELVAWVTRFRDLAVEHEAELTALDSAIGDADHGGNMVRGLRAAADALEKASPSTPKDALKTAAMALISHVGGASGPLYGTVFLRASAAVGDAESLDTALLGRALRAGLEGVIARGKAQPGDKTLVDAFAPAVDAFDAAAAEGLPKAVAAARVAAEQGRDATGPLVARKGRASYLGERSAGHIDPGAASTALLFEALDETVSR